MERNEKMKKKKKKHESTSKKHEQIFKNMKNEKNENYEKLKIKKMQKHAQRETTLRPPLRLRCAMEEPLTPIRNCGGYGKGYHLLLLPCHSILPHVRVDPTVAVHVCWTEAKSVRQQPKLRIVCLHVRRQFHCLYFV